MVGVSNKVAEAELPKYLVSSAPVVKTEECSKDRVSVTLISSISWLFEAYFINKLYYPLFTFSRRRNELFSSFSFHAPHNQNVSFFISLMIFICFILFAESTNEKV